MSLRRKIIVALSTLSVAWALCTASASAQDSDNADDDESEEGSGDRVVRTRLGPVAVRLTAQGTLSWYAAFGIGMRADIAIVKDGLLETVNDDLSLSVGADVLYFWPSDRDGFGVMPIAAMQWNFYLNDRWSLFPELGTAFIFVPARRLHFPAFVLPYAGIGARYHFSRRNALLMRAGWPVGFQVGVTF